MAIKTFKHKGLKQLFEIDRTAKIGKEYHKTATMILDLLDNIVDINDCVGVKNFHELKKQRPGTYSMHVTGNWCITFRWDGQDIHDVDFEDYH
jgi:proteic killer suppression protein